MAKTDINENIYRAIDTIIDARLQNVNFNSTVLCTIVDDSKAASGIFTVDNAGIKFQATSMDKSFKVNDQVYVTVPNNNFDAQKIIIGKKEDFAKLQEQWKDPFSYLDIKYKFDDDSEEVEITPTYQQSPAPEPQLIKRLILNNIFDDNLDIENYNIYQTEEEARKTLKDSGWKQVKAEEDLKKPQLKGILKRRLGIKSSNIQDPNPLHYYNTYLFRIKTLNNDQIPIDSSTVHYYSGPQKCAYAYQTDRWNEKGYFAPQYENTGTWVDDYFPANASGVSEEAGFPFTFTSFAGMFYAYYNEKQYQPIILAGLKNIIITADFKTNLNEDNVTTGNYTLICKLMLENIDNFSPKKTIFLIMSSDKDFLGDPYNYFDYFTQTALFDCSQYQNYILNSIEFWCKQNNNFQNVSENSKIYIKNPKIYFGVPVQEEVKGYKNFESVFRTSGKYYQKLDFNTVNEIYQNLDQIPPIDTELDSDGPFLQKTGDLYDDGGGVGHQKTYDTSIVNGKTYYKHIPQGGGTYIWEAVTPISNPYKEDLFEQISIEQRSRYIPKIFIKDEEGKYVQLSNDKLKYYDQIQYFYGRTTTHDWSENKYRWDSVTRTWHLLTTETSSTEWPEELDLYVCYPPGKEVSGYVGAIEKEDESIPPQIGISSSEKNTDIALIAEAQNADILLNTVHDSGQVILNANDKATIILDKDNITLTYNKDQNNKIVIRLGNNDSSQPAINMAVKNNNAWGQVHLDNDKLTKLAKLLDIIDIQQDEITFNFSNPNNDYIKLILDTQTNIPGNAIDLRLEKKSASSSNTYTWTATSPTWQNTNH